MEENNQTTYYLRSSVLGGAIVDEIRQDYQQNAVKTEGYVYANGERIARQSSSRYEHHNPVTESWVMTDAANRYLVREERDPVGAQLPLSQPPNDWHYANANFGSPLFIDGGDPSDYSGGLEIDNMPVSAAEFARRMGDGAVSAEYLIHGDDGLKFVQGGITPLGLGMFERDYPKPDNEGWHWGVTISSFDHASQISNPNCMLNFVRTRDGRVATEIGGDVGPGHDGRHDVSPISTGSVDDYGGDVVALPALNGAQVVRYGVQGLEGTGDAQAFYLDMRLSNGMVLVLKDLKSLNPSVKRGLQFGKTGSGIKLKSNMQLGTIFANPYRYTKNARSGLHVTLVVRDYDLYVNARKNGIEDRTKWIIDPLSSGSPFRCPGLSGKKTIEGFPIP